MSRAGVTILDVEQAIFKLQGRGKNPSVDAIREALGTGSKSTIAQHLRDWKAQQPGGPQGKLPQDLLGLVSGLWERLSLKAEQRIQEIEETSSQRELALKQTLAELQQNHLRLQKQLHQSEEAEATLTVVKETLEINLRTQQQEHVRLIERDLVTQQQLESQKTENARLHQLANNIQANLEHYQQAVQQLQTEQHLAIEKQHAREDTDELDRECLKKMIPDSYDPCPCASEKKYKFCCKKVFSEIMEAMIAAEEGDYTSALKWIDKAKSVVGETAEVICRESIVYSYFDGKKSNDLLAQCLSINPNHPRAHYLIGLMLKQSGDIEGAVTAYQAAIRHYPPTDVFHLNEAYNNLGSAFYTGGNIEEAKSAWEKALLYLPSDKTTRRNLAEFIHNRKIG